MSDIEMLKKRLTELARRAYSRSACTCSDFLTLYEQSELRRLPLGRDCAPFTLVGGYEGAERRVALFGGEGICGYEAGAPICCVCISPVRQKFADALTHRDFLGSLMALGIRRETMGDIVVSENRGYLFCLDTIAGYIEESLTQVRRTSVRCERCDPPEVCAALPEQTGVSVASERLDALVAAVFRLSRSESGELFAHEKVFVDGRLVTSGAASPKPGELVSVRGLGRFRYDGVGGETRRGRLRALVRIYGRGL